MYHVYVLKSRQDGGLYVGITESLERRLRQHNAGQTSSTRPRPPFDLLFSESFEDRPAARAREKYYKSGIGRERLASSLPTVAGIGGRSEPQNTSQVEP